MLKSSANSSRTHCCFFRSGSAFTSFAYSSRKDSRELEVFCFKKAHLSSVALDTDVDTHMQAQVCKNASLFRMQKDPNNLISSESEIEWTFFPLQTMFLEVPRPPSHQRCMQCFSARGPSPLNGNFSVAARPLRRPDTNEISQRKTMYSVAFHSFACNTAQASTRSNTDETNSEMRHVPDRTPGSSVARGYRLQAEER